MAALLMSSMRDAYLLIILLFEITMLLTVTSDEIDPYEACGKTLYRGL